MPNANQLQQLTFDGPLQLPSVRTVWPGVTFPDAGGAANPSFEPPIVDGDGHGFASIAVSHVDWRALANVSPAVPDYQARLWCKWASPGFQGRREVGIIFRAKDGKTFLVLRVRSMGPAAPELRLFKVVNNVETQLGATITHATLSASRMSAGMWWTVRVEDLLNDDDETRVTAYIHPPDNSNKGTQVLDWTGALGEVRNAYKVGVELRDQVGYSDVRVDNLTVLDLADEWDPGEPPPGTGAPASGWELQIGGSRRYSMTDLANLSPPVELITVRDGYGFRAQRLELLVHGQYQPTSLIKPGVAVVAWHDDVARFRGVIEDGSLDATPEQGQTWYAYSNAFQTKDVMLSEDDRTGQHFFNVTDPEADDYETDRQNMTVGQVLSWHFDRYLSKLRAMGAAPPDGSTAYVQAQIDALDAVIPDLVTGGSFSSTVEQLLNVMAYKFQQRWDPHTYQWEFRDVTNLQAQAIELTNAAQPATMRINPDRGLAYSAVVWRGARKERGEDLQLSLSGGDLIPAWTKEQESKYGKDKRSKSFVTGHLLVAGEGELNNDGWTERPYFDIAAGLLDNDDVIGWSAHVQGDGFVRLVVPGQTSTRIWMSPPAWGGGSPPAPGSAFTLRAETEESLAILSAQGVGRGYYLKRPETICPGYAGAYKGHDLQHKGFCGTARAVAVGDDGVQKYSEPVEFDVVVPNQTQRAAGFCGPVVRLADKPKPPVGLVNKLPPKSSTPKGHCEPGVQNQPASTPLIDIELTMPQLKAEAPYVRCPTEEDTFQGDAHDDWNNVSTYLINDPDFTDQDAQGAGIAIACQHILDVKSQKPWLFDIELAAPWSTTRPEQPTLATVNPWFGLNRRVLLTSAVAPTGFEVDENLPVLSVTAHVKENKLTLQAGTVSAWLQFNGVDVAKRIAEARVLKKALTAVKQLGDYMNQALAKSVERVGTRSNASIDGCEVVLGNDQVKRVVNVQRDDEDKIKNITHGKLAGDLAMSLIMGVEHDFPGAPIAVPGFDGHASKEIAGVGPLALFPGDHRIPFQSVPPGVVGRGKYGGLLASDPEQDYTPPRELLRAGGLVFRKRESADGTWDGAPGAEVSAIDGDGNPTGGFTIYTRPRDLPGGAVPPAILSPGGLVHTAFERSKHLASRMLLVEGQLGALRYPGIDDGSGDLPPADLLDHVTANIIGNDFRLVRESLSDPGGLVFEGPMREGGANAEAFWRVEPRTKVPVLVQAAPPGTGTRGGAWVYDQTGPGGSLEFLAHGTIHTKQVHMGSDWEQDVTQPGAVGKPGVAQPGHPFGMTAHLWQWDNVQPSGIGFTVDAPPNVRGKPMFWITAGEDPYVAAPGPGLTIDLRIDHAYRASPWPGAPTAGTPQAPVVTDPTGTGTGLYLQPGGAVPPGLRQITASAVYTPGAGTYPQGPGAGKPILLGGGVELALTETGYLLIVPEELGLSDQVSTNHPTVLERLGISDAYALEIGKNIAEALSLHDDARPILNPPVEVFERLGLHDEVATELNP